jgi:zinc D-Ala-D-Ala carboxypeptidase
MTKVRRKLQPKRLLVVIALSLLVVLLLALGVLGFSYWQKQQQYNAITLNFVNPTETIEAYSEVDVVSWVANSSGVVTYPMIDFKTLGTQEAIFQVTDDKGMVRDFVYQYTVVDTTAPELLFSTYTITTMTLPVNYDNLLTNHSDLVDGPVQVEYQGTTKPEPGMYIITAIASDKSNNTVSKKLYVLYQLNPETMTKDFLMVDDILIANKKFPLSKDYDPGRDVQANRALTNMLEAASSDGHNIPVLSAYRSYESQSRIFQLNVDRLGYEQASKEVAVPGYSEHQTGLAYDIGSITSSFANTSAFDWLSKNADKYGFILRYPKGKESITGYIYEPWHYRYVGVDLAGRIKASGLCLEEYLGLE